MTINVLDHGFVRLVEHMGDDKAPVRAARISYGEETKGDEADKKLLHYLIKHKHHTPLEMVVYEFHVKCPIFVARQWMRHRIGSFNEISGRYVEIKNEFYIPETYRVSAEYSKQGSQEPTEAFIEKINAEGNCDYFESHEEWNEVAKEGLYFVCFQAYSEYVRLIKMGVAKEMARMVLPVNIYTQFYWCINMRSLFNFLNLRLDSHAQWEIQQYAQALLEIVKDKNPWLAEAFDLYVRDK